MTSPLDALRAYTTSAVKAGDVITAKEITSRKWEISGRYGRWYVEQYRQVNGVWESGTYGYDIQASSRRTALEIASALNAAYAAGVTEAR